MKSPPSTVPPVTPRSTEIENLGNITGRRTNGITTVGGGDPMLRAFNWYGKKDPPGMGSNQRRNPPSGPMVVR